MRRALLVMLTLTLAAPACRPAALPLAPDHPARAGAPTGRLAGPPAALRVREAREARE